MLFIKAQLQTLGLYVPQLIINISYLIFAVQLVPS